MPANKAAEHLRIKGKHGIVWISPSFDPEMMPGEAANILKKTYAAVRDQQYEENKNNRENMNMKAKAAAIAWSAVEKAGFKKGKDGKWTKTKKSQSFSKPIQLFADEIKLNKSEILMHIPSETYARIKEKDETPIFAPYVIAHEGYSTPRIIGEGQTRIYWPRKAIESFKGLIKKGIKFFIGHNEDNSTKGRQDVGEVVGSFQKEVDGKLNQIAIAYFPEKKTAEKYKVCSIEAIGEFFDKAGQVIADGINELTGIALGIDEKPAFPETGQIGYIQAFGENVSIDDGGESSINKNGGEPRNKGYKMTNLTLEEMKAQIVLSGWNPGQLFDMTKIISDTVFQERLKESKKKIIDFDELEKSKAEFEKLQISQKELQEKLTKYDRDIQKNTSKSRYEEKIKGLNLTEKQRKFFDVQYNKLTEFTDEAIDNFILKSQDDYKELTSAGLLADPVQNVTISNQTEKNPFIIED